MAIARLTKDEVKTKVIEVNALRASGMSGVDAIKQVGLSRKTYDRNRKKYPAGMKGNGGLQGTMRVDQLPPRPKKHGGKRPPKPVDMTDIASVATRIARLDRKLRNIDDMVKQRVALVARLLVLLKKKA